MICKNNYLKLVPFDHFRIQAQLLFIPLGLPLDEASVLIQFLLGNFSVGLKCLFVFFGSQRDDVQCRGTDDIAGRQKLRLNQFGLVALIVV